MLLIVKVYNLVCDGQGPGCLDSTDDYVPLPADRPHAARIVRRAAVRAGWVHTDDDRDLCPVCATRGQTDPPAQLPEVP